MTEDALKRRFAMDLLGPVFFAFCHRLWLHHQAFGQRKARGLFLARGGLRLLVLYRLFLANQMLSSPITCHSFMVSRLTVTQAGLILAPALAMRSLMREYQHSTLGEVVTALGPADQLPSDGRQALVDCWDTRCTDLGLYQFLNSRHPRAEQLRQHCEKQAALLGNHLAAIAGDATDLVLCDTGLFGTTQALLMASYPHYVWSGTYFGRCNYRHESAPHHVSSFGLIVEKNRPSVWAPETAFLRYWHLCEMPLEPNLPSVSHYFFDSVSGAVQSNLEQPGWKEAVTAADNPFFAGVLDYFNTVGPQTTDQINIAHIKALREIMRRVCLPTYQDVLAMVVGDRSPDYGRTDSAPVVSYPKNQESFTSKLRTVRKALWKEGQIILCFPTMGKVFNLIIFIARGASDIVRLLRGLF